MKNENEVDASQIRTDKACTNKAESVLTKTVAREPIAHHSMQIFWMENGEPKNAPFSSLNLGLAMQLCETLRRRAKAGENICHVCVSSELADHVGQAGVDDKLPADYDWSKKHRGTQYGYTR